MSSVRARGLSPLGSTASCGRAGGSRFSRPALSAAFLAPRHPRIREFVFGLAERRVSGGVAYDALVAATVASAHYRSTGNAPSASTSSDIGAPLVTRRPAAATLRGSAAARLEAGPLRDVADWTAGSRAPPPMPRLTRRRSAGLRLRSKGRGKCSTASASTSPWPRHERYARSTQHDGEAHPFCDAVSRRIHRGRAGQDRLDVPDEERQQFVNDALRPVGTHLYGRRMYETIQVWMQFGSSASDPARARDFAGMWRAADKVVYSKTLKQVSTPRTRLEQTFDVDGIREMSRERRMTR
jgi:hypothetical protein